MTITAAPFALVDWAGWKIATSGPKPKVYASDGVSVSEFQKVIENVEGGNGIPDLKVGRDKISLFEYYGKKTNCYGRFKDNKAINHWRYTLVGAHPDTAPDAIDMAERRAPIRRVFRWFLNWPGRRPAFRGQCQDAPGPPVAARAKPGARWPRRRFSKVRAGCGRGTGPLEWSAGRRLGLGWDRSNVEPGRCPAFQAISFRRSLRFELAAWPNINGACHHRFSPLSTPPRASARSMARPLRTPLHPRCTTPRSPRSA